MARLYIFADEAGDFAFKRGPNISRYFIVCTTTTHSSAAANALLDLRRELAWEGAKLGGSFHASTDSQAVRNRVFDVICQQDFQVQATIMEKSKARPHVRETGHSFYRYGWFYHFSYGMKRYVDTASELLITAASVGTKRGQIKFTDAVNDVVGQTIRRRQWKTAFWPAATDPCLQLADYCTWAIQRKWERNDERSYVLIRDRIVYEYDLWAHGTVHHY